MRQRPDKKHPLITGSKPRTQRRAYPDDVVWRAYTRPKVTAWLAKAEALPSPNWTDDGSDVATVRLPQPEMEAVTDVDVVVRTMFVAMADSGHEVHL